MGTKVYFIGNKHYVRFDRVMDQVDAEALPPKPLAGSWTGLAEVDFDTDLDTVVNWGNGKLYFFKGDRYLRYDIAGDKVDSEPRSIADGWNGLAAAGFGSGIDVAITWPNGKAYFFKGDRYIRYDMASDKADGAPSTIANGWSGFDAAGFSSDLDAAAHWHDGHVYFFKGDQYIKFSIADDRVVEGYPRPIVGNWNGIDAVTKTSKLCAAIDLLDLTQEIWVDGINMVKAPKYGPKFINSPWRGVLHTTEGASVQSAIEGSFRPQNWWPHFTIDLEKDEYVQHIPLNVGSRALSDKDVKANAANCIQIEMVGKAEQSSMLSEASLARLRKFLLKIHECVPIAFESSRSFLDASGVNRTPNNRMKSEEWYRFAGWCGHQHVPNESHWDPGAIDMKRVLTP